MIIITQANHQLLILICQTWDAQFKSAIKKGVQPEGTFLKEWLMNSIKRNGSMIAVDIYLVV
jgi:hypothetical protein